MRKIFVLDTNVLIHDPYCIKNFRGNDVVLPIYVLEEIDKLKRNQNSAIQARMVSRVLDKIRKKGHLSTGVELENDVFFRVEIKNDLKKLPEVLSKDLVDNYILAATIGIIEDNPDRRVIIVTKDINMRIKADALDIEVEDYQTDKVDYNELYDGFYEINITSEQAGKYDKYGSISVDELELKGIKPLSNTYFKLNVGNKTFTGRHENGKIKKFLLGDSSAWGLRARNDEQRFAMDLLLDDNIKVVTLVGGAGTGKTLLAIATGLEQVVERRKFKKLLIARPIIPMGKDIGYLPGDEKEKLRPWMQPIFDNIDFLSESKDERAGEKVVETLESMGILKIEPLTYIRGRSIPHGYIIIDEAQNLTPLEIKTIITRVGEDTKIVFTGDPQQIDNPYLDASTNGLTYLADRLKNEEIVGHVTLKKGERSKVAEIAVALL
ncbi:PhoH family protein [Fusobacterium sp. PH5-44]|uniref:PhoH family protein n=1 Tax=unclassified Fusobacterium TaxID=2648384 RepID=UPI003D19945A